MKKVILILFASSVVLYSCKKCAYSNNFEKNVVYKNLPSFESIYKFATDNNTSGKFMVTTSTPLGYKDLNKFFEININGAFLNKSTQQNEAGQPSFFNNIMVESNQALAYYKDLRWSEGASLFGAQLKLKLQRGGGASLVGDTVVDYNGGYSPQIFISYNNFLENATTTGGTYISGTKLRPLFKFSWNADTANRNGVFVYLEYDPTNFANDSLKNIYPIKKANGVIVEDNGEYVLTSELFDEIPLNARLNVYIGRGNFEYIKQEDGTLTDMQMTVLTYQYGEFFYKLD